MSIHHHLNEATLMAYAAGTLPESMNLVIATHLSQCSTCRKKVDEMEEMGAGSLENDPGLAMKSDALDQIMTLLDADEKPKVFQAANDHSAASASVPLPLRRFVPDGLEKVSWRNMAPGIKCYTLPGVNARKGSVRLMKLAPGVAIPEHGHNGTELTLVLSGSFSDEVGRFKAGDIADLDDDIDHQPIADSDQECICLIATEYPLRFKTMVPKIMQYFVGM